MTTMNDLEDTREFTAEELAELQRRLGLNQNRSGSAGTVGGAQRSSPQSTQLADAPGSPRLPRT